MISAKETVTIYKDLIVLKSLCLVGKTTIAYCLMFRIVVYLRNI